MITNTIFITWLFKTHRKSFMFAWKSDRWYNCYQGEMKPDAPYGTESLFTKILIIFCIFQAFVCSIFSIFYQNVFSILTFVYIIDQQHIQIVAYQERICIHAICSNVTHHKYCTVLCSWYLMHQGEMKFDEPGFIHDIIIINSLFIASNIKLSIIYNLKT